MPYTDKQKKQIIDKICLRVSEGEALRNICLDKDLVTSNTFYSWIDKNEEMLALYARATEKRSDDIFEDILEISDNRAGDTYKDKDGIERIDHAVVQRDRLRVDSRKWIASKLNPKKYGDRIEVNSTNKNIGEGMTREEQEKMMEEIRKKLEE